MRLSAVLGTVALFAAVPASASVLTVSPSGSDSANGITAPLKTFQRAVALLNSGDTILLQPGTYTAGAYIQANNVTIQGQGTVILDGTSATRTDGLSFTQSQNVTIDGVKIRNCKRKGLFVTLSDGLTVRNCEFSNNASDGFLTGNTSDVLVENCTSFNNGYHGVYLSQSGDRLTVRNNTMYGNYGAGLQINAVEDSPNAGNPASSDSTSHNCTIEGNTIYNCGSGGGSALNFMGLQDSLVVNNLLYNNLAGGIALWDDGAGAAFASKNNRIFHNTVVFQSGKGRFGIQLLAGSTGNQIANNILVCGSGPDLDAQASCQSNYNCFGGSKITGVGSLAAWQSASGNDVNSAAGDPGLTSDYHLATGSPARDGGVTVYPTDKDGNPRPQGANADLGCYEMSAGGGGTTVPAAPTGLVASAGDARVTLTWNASSGATGYYLYRSPNGSSSWVHGALQAATSLLDTNVTNGTAYWYRVTAVNAGGTESTPSSSVTATPQAAQVQTYTISGTVTATGSGVSGVVIGGGGQSATTAANGTYTLSRIPAGTYTVTASKSGYTCSAAQTVTVGPNRAGVNFTATANSTGGSADGVIFDNSLRTGWSSAAAKAKYSLTVTNPVSHGNHSIGLTITGVDGALALTGAGIATSGKAYLRFSINGGAKGGQKLRLRSVVDGVQQSNSLNLTSYGGDPAANQWKEYSIPLSDLKASQGNLTGIKIFAGTRQKQAYIAFIRVE